ncbi:unnamed protein product [Vicia faba]|uniref:Uncharacterized protein n=1 Tax=Vicia faba TaxID=3906 RepID=A0AAV1AWS1_VICFA|nr:unnamed protein product [Vicia faba]
MLYLGSNLWNVLSCLLSHCAKNLPYLNPGMASEVGNYTIQQEVKSRLNHQSNVMEVHIYIRKNRNNSIISKDEFPFELIDAECGEGRGTEAKVDVSAF